MRNPFLEILTRTFNQRPRMLARNVASLQALTCPDWLQTMLIDEECRGVEWAQENMGGYAQHLVGEYIWILDDDDECIYPGLIEGLIKIAIEHNPDVIMVNMEHTGLGVLPGKAHWQKPPSHGFIGCSAYIVRRLVWQLHAGAFFPGVYHSDFNFINAIFESGASVYWWDIVASKTQRRSYGQGE